MPDPFNELKRKKERLEKEEEEEERRQFQINRQKLHVAYDSMIEEVLNEFASLIWGWGEVEDENGKTILDYIFKRKKLKPQANYLTTSLYNEFGCDSAWIVGNRSQTLFSFAGIIGYGYIVGYSIANPDSLRVGIGKREIVGGTMGRTTYSYRAHKYFHQGAIVYLPGFVSTPSEYKFDGSFLKELSCTGNKDELKAALVLMYKFAHEKKLGDLCES